MTYLLFLEAQCFNKLLEFQWVLTLLADLFLYSYEAEFAQKLLTNKQNTLAASFNFTFRYIDDP